MVSGLGYRVGYGRMMGYNSGLKCDSSGLNCVRFGLQSGVWSHDEDRCGLNRVRIGIASLR
jgi:hypothetical protein